MPNIEIHGLFFREEAQKLLEQIFNLFRVPNPVGKASLVIKDHDITSDLVVTISEDDCEDAAAIPQPFLRVLSTPQPYLDELLRVLNRHLRINIEFVQLKMFLPKPEEPKKRKKPF